MPLRKFSPVPHATVIAMLATIGLGGPVAAGEYAVAKQRIEDRKAVYATVESADTLLARARIGGTVGSLAIDEGDLVESGQAIAVIGDAKLALQIGAHGAKVQSLKAARDQAAIDLARARELRKSGTLPQARLDEAETALQVAERNLAAATAERQVIVEQSREGAVLAPGAGRVLRVHVTDGAVVMPGEVIATLAAERYLLRLNLPERHARFLKVGDEVLVGPRGVERVRSNDSLRTGRVVQVYPQMSQGRVVADVEVEGLGDYFVGERTLVYVSTGAREAVVVPEGALYNRYGQAFVRLKDGTEVVVQPGQPVRGGIEILSGLRDGDVVVTP